VIVTVCVSRFRCRWKALGAFAALVGLGISPGAWGFGLSQVDAIARSLAEAEYRPPPSIPDLLGDLSADTFAQIRLRDEAPPDWPGARFAVRPIAAGHVYRAPVELFEVVEGEVRRIAFDKANFEWPGESFDRKVPADLGFAGFSIDYPLTQPGSPETVLRFLGGSLFRGVASDQVMGAHARGLAIDTGLPSGEEFPAFRRFWLVRPAPGERRMTLYALMDSESLTGAYRFVLEPGERRSTVHVEAHLHARRPVDRLGLAPVSSMYFYGRNERPDASHWRPAVFSSSGLLVHQGDGGWTYRPLRNPDTLRLDTFAADGVRGFGLVQRHTTFSTFEDPVARFERRPSVWVTPQAGFGSGRLDLIQLPLRSDGHENQLVFFEPANPFKPGRPLSMAYDVSFGHRAASTAGHPAQVRGVLIGVEGIGEDSALSGPAYRVNVDFTGGDLATLADNAPVVASIEDAPVRVLEHSVTPLPDEATWRLSMLVQPKSESPVTLRAALAVEGNRISETWQDMLPGRVDRYLEQGK